MSAIAQAFTSEERRAYIGASEIAAIMGLDAYKTPLDVYRDKVGLSEPFLGNNHTERGNRLEAIAAEYYTEKSGFKLRRQSAALTHPGYPNIVGHVDRVVVGEKRLVEIKCPSVAAFRKHQREGLPVGYVIQAQVYLALSNAQTLTFAIFCADVWDMAIFDIVYDGTIAGKALQAADDFWNNHVLPGIPPDASAKTDLEIASHDGSVTRRDDEPFVARSAALREAIALKRDADELLETAKAEFIACIEETPGIYEAPGLRVHFNECPGRVSLDKKAMTADGIDLGKYEKRGSSYKEFRSYLLGEN